jgi:hypothetical protein
MNINTKAKTIVILSLLTCFIANTTNAQYKGKALVAAKNNAEKSTFAVTKTKIDIGNPSLKNITIEQQTDAVMTILQYCAADAMHDFFRQYQGDIKPAIFSAEVIAKARSFGYMFAESPESSNRIMKDWIQSINYNLKNPLLQFAAATKITKPNKVLQGGSNGITTYFFATYQVQLQAIVTAAVNATFIELAHANNTKSFFPLVQSYDFGALDKDARPLFTAFILKQLQARFTTEEFLLRDNPPVANNGNVMKVFGGVSNN